MSSVSADVVAILRDYFGEGDAANASERAQQIAANIKEVLLDADFLDTSVDEIIEYDDFDNDPDFLIDVNCPEDSDSDEPDFKRIKFSDQLVAKEAFINNGKSWIKNTNHLAKLREIEKKGIDSANRIAAMHELKKDLAEWVTKKFSEGISLRDINIREVALRINKQRSLLENFKASHGWIQKFKKENRICSRRVTKFISKKRFSDKDKIIQDSKKFVESIQELIVTENIPLRAVCNADQSGFAKEMHCARSLAFRGQKRILRVVNSVPATTHSFTIMPIICADGTVSKKLYVVLQEANGKLPKKGCFAADNLYVDVHTTHIMNKNLMSSWIENCVVPNMPKKMLLLVDSWTSFKDHQEILRHVPKGHELFIRNIPAGATSDIQPCDVGLFLYFKKFIKKMTSYVQVHDIQFVVSRRDNILKMISQVWHIISHPKFSNFIAYAFFKSGYIPRPPHYLNPVDASFPSDIKDSCDENGCRESAFIMCPYCDDHFCFVHFIVDYHRC